MAAGGAIIGALRVVLGADTAALEKGLKDAQGKLSQFGAGAGKALAAAGAAMTVAATALGVAVKGAINQADELGKMAQKVGVPVEELSALKHAADLSGVSIESLAKSAGRLARATVEAAQGLQTPVNAFRALGIEFRNSEGQIKSVSELLPDLADRFSRMRDGPEKTALAMQLLGRAGADLIPLLNMGRDGLRETMEEAKALGLVIDTQTAKSAEAFNDNLTRLGRVFSGIVMQVAARMAPALESLSQLLVSAAKNAGLLDTAATVLTATLRGLVTAGVLVGATFKAMGDIIASVASAVMLVAQGEFTKAWEALKSSSADVAATIAGTGNALRMIWGETAAAADNAGKAIGNAFNPAITKTTKDALDSFLAGTQKRMAAMQAEIATIGLGTMAREKLRISLEAETIAKENNIKITDALRAKIEQVAEAYALMADRIEGKRIWEATRTPAEEFGRTIEDLNGKMQRGSIDAETYARAVAQAQDKLVSANPHAQNLGNALESAFDRAMESGAQLGDVIRALIQDLIKMEARTAFKMLLYGNAGQGGGFAGIIGSIFSALPAFASGGSFNVGGAGGVDSQLVAFKASPNENVTVTKPGQMIAGGSGGGFTYAPTYVFDGDMAPSNRQWVMGLIAQSEQRTRSDVTSIVRGDLALDRDALGLGYTG